MRVLVTGVSGFAGSHLAELLLSEGHEVYGFTNDPSLDNNLASLKGAVKVFSGDLRSREDVRTTLATTCPERIYHLAAITPGRGAGEDPSYWEVNVGGTALLLDEAARLPETRVHIAGSSAEYGLLPVEANPITEGAELKPVGVYSVSKAAQGLLAFSYWAHQGLWVVRTRAFNHTGPREDTGFACSTFARQIAEAELGHTDGAIRVGNLDAYRDISDVRDVVRAYVAALEKGRAGQVYNVCSGVAVQIREILEALMSMSSVPLRVELDKARLRPSEVPYQRGDATMLAEETGWRPEIPLEQTLRDLLEYWRVRGQAH